MKKIYFLLLPLAFYFHTDLHAQTVNLNESFIQQHLRRAQLLGKLDPSFSFTARPVHTGKNGLAISSEVLGSTEYGTTVLSFLGDHGKLKLLPVDYLMEYSSHHPYNRNNGSLIPNRGYQQLLSFGVYAELGPLSVQFKPEHVYAENRDYEGFWDGHYDVIWARRYNAWNVYDLPERFGNTAYKKTLLGQSSIRLNWKGLSLGFSTENIWWGPSRRNSIMMSNHAQGFKHLTFNTTRPLKTPIGNFEWQLVTGRLEASGFTPPNIERKFAGTTLYYPKKDDWRYYQGFTVTYSPKWLKGFSMGFVRWVQAYHEFVYENRDYFPAFDNLFRKNDKFNTTLEMERDQAAGLFLRWLWNDAKAEVYGEFHHNDSKANLRDLILDADHSRAATIGIHKLFQSNTSDKIYEFSWEWTQMEQSSSRLLRNAGSWYMHSSVRHGYANNGEVLGASIGPGSNSHYFELAMIDNFDRYGLAFEVIDQDNDFFVAAFEEAKDFRRYWKDLNIHASFEKKYKNFWGAINLIYIRSLNYQWEIDDHATPYYHPGRDVNNFHVNFKLTYHFDLKK